MLFIILKIRLKVTAVPHVFLMLPQYLSSNTAATRPTTLSTSAARLINENIRNTKQADLLFERETVKNLLEFKEKIKTSGFVSVKEGSSIFYHYIKSSANHLLDTPKLLGTVVVITNKLEVQVFVSSTPIPRSSYHHLLHSSTIKTTTNYYICCHFANLLVIDLLILPQTFALHW